MIGIVLCAGRGTRLGLKDRPKCMVDVGGKPLIERIANHLEKNGIKRIIVNLGVFPEVVMKYFGQRFLYLYEPVPIGEYNTISLLKGYFPEEDILAVNGDTLTDFFPKLVVKGRGKKHNGYTIYQKDGNITRIFNDDFIDCGTPEGLAEARKKYG